MDFIRKREQGTGNREQGKYLLFFYLLFPVTCHLSPVTYHLSAI
ncbi:hypothetical protein [Trichormus sp. NMC-1]|nr:hypothetical protein [Trichormus sp. NMC-1]